MTARARKGQVSFLMNFLFAFLFFSFIGLAFFMFATSNVPTTARDYNESELEQLDLTSEVNTTFENLESIVNPTNETGFGESSTSQADNLLFTAADLGRSTFSIPQYVYGIFELAANRFGIDTRILMFVVLSIVIVLIVIFIQIALGRY